MCCYAKGGFSLTVSGVPPHLTKCSRLRVSGADLLDPDHRYSEPASDDQSHFVIQPG